ncbi:Gypsy retrotransposon integrase-like protein 1, partial [Frankliniella fusca]
MDVSRLHKDELLFELAYRGLDLKKEKKTVTELRALLSERIEREAAGEEFESLVTWEDVDEGLILFQTKVELLNELVRPAGGDFDPSSAGRTRALASHCNKRLIALMERYDEMSPEMRTDVKKQAILLKTLVSEFRSMGESRVYAASSVQSVSAVEGWEPPQRPAVVRPAGVARGMVVGGGAVERKQAVRASVQTRSRTSRKSKKSRRKKSAISSSSASSSSSDSSDAEPVSRRTRLSSVPMDLHKWGVQPFSGDQSVSVCSFLSDIEEKARWRRVNLDSLVAAASEFFCGEAKVRYRSIAGSIDSWKEFCIKVKEEFLPMDYYDNLMEEIRSRKQGPEETVSTYVANMCALFDRLGTGVDEEHRQYEGWKLAITVKNLAPYYTDRLTLVKVASFEHLKQLGRDIEARGSFHELPPLQAKGGSLRACARRDRVRSPRKSKVLFEEVETIQVDVRGDGRLYVLVELYGVKFFGLLDSGATASTVGGGAWDKLRSYNKISVIGQDSWEKLCRSEVKLQPCRTKHVKVADGQTCPVLGCLDAPVLLDGKMKVCKFLVVPHLKQDIILGVDFWRTFGLLPDVVKGTCALAESELPVMEEIIIPKDKLSEEERTLLDQRGRVEADPESFPSWRVEGDQLYKLLSVGLGPPQWNRVVPKDLRDKVLFECHDRPLAGHRGVNKTYYILRSQYYWPEMRRDVQAYVASCATCIQYKTPQTKPAGVMGERRVVDAPFQFVASDLMGPFPRSYAGYTHLAVTTCLFSKYVWLRPLRSIKAAQIKWLDVYQDVARRLKEAYEKSARHYNLRRREKTFHVGQLVYYANKTQSDKVKFYSRKLAPNYLGPCTVESRKGTSGYVLRDAKGNLVGPYHVQDLVSNEDFKALRRPA